MMLPIRPTALVLLGFLLTGCTEPKDDVEEPKTSTTAAADVAPAVSGAKADPVGSVSAKILWNVAGDSTVKSEVEYSSTGPPKKSPPGAGKGAQEATITELHPETSYSVRVHAWDARGRSAYSPNLTIKTIAAEKTVSVTSTAFAANQPIPAQYTCDGPEQSPPLALAQVPTHAKKLAMIMDDPDAPGGTWVHWVFWNVGTRASLPAGFQAAANGGVDGQNSAGEEGYQGPCPPPGSPHHYHHKVYALSADVVLAKGSTKAQLESAMKGKILAWGELVGTYQTP